MNDSLDLTFAELRYLVAGWPATVRDLVVDQLRLPDEAESLAQLERSGFASLTVRELVGEVDGTPNVIADELKIVLIGLRAAGCWVRLAGSTSGQPRAVIVAVGEQLTLVAMPAGLQTYRFGLLSPDAELETQIVRAVDSVLSTRDSLALVSVRGDAVESRLGVAVDANGEWLISDSVHNPDGAVLTTRAEALERVAAIAGSEDRR